MDVIVAEGAGFCFGVKRAVELSREAVKEYGKPVFTFGELIHNKRFIKELQNEGIFVKNKIDDFRADDTVVIRAHGISPALENELKRRVKKVIDGTCPLVKNVHRYIKKIVSSGKVPVIVGKRGHPEVIAEIGYAEGKAVLISSIEEAMEVDFRNLDIGLVAQTTFPPDKLKSITDYIIRNSKKVEIYDTICSATLARKKASLELSKEVDVVYVIGGKHSSNTKTLYEMIKNINPNVYHIESKEEINTEALLNFKKIGLTGGASTPKEYILEVKEYILNKIAPRRIWKNGRSEKF